MSLSCIFIWFKLSPTVLRKAFNIRLSGKALDPWKILKFSLFKCGKLAFARDRNEAGVAKLVFRGWSSPVPRCWYFTDAGLALGHCFPESRTLILRSRCYSIFSVSWRESILPELRAGVPPTRCAARLPPGAQSRPEPALSDGCSDECCIVQALAAWKQTWRSFTNKVCFFPLGLWLCFLLLTCPVFCQKLNTPLGNV